MRPWRRSEPAGPSGGGGRLALRLDRLGHLPGDTVRGSVAVIEGGGSGEIRVSLNFRERSAPYEAIAGTIPGGTVHGGELAPGSAHSFAIELPPDAPPSCRSRHGELWWTVDASVGEPASGAVSRRIEVAAAPSGTVAPGAGAAPPAG